LLEVIARAVGSPFLFTQDAKRRKRPISQSSMTYQVYLYVAAHDRDHRFVRTWKDPSGKVRLLQFEWTDGVPPHLGRFRESLAMELARGDCGMAFLTLQLHHTHSTLHRIGQTTLGYGRQAEVALHGIEGSAPPKAGAHRVNPGLLERVGENVVVARESLFAALYDENRKRAGGGAEEHDRRVAGFFSGKRYSAVDRAKFIRKAARSGAPLKLCGYGVCGKRCDEKENPCAGDLCPVDCANHLVLETAKPIIVQRWAHCLKQLSRPEQAHNREKWRWDKEWYERQLAQLGVDVATLDTEHVQDAVTELVIESYGSVSR
jgi:hypothetical protein